MGPKFPNNPNRQNSKIAKSICGAVLPCAKYEKYIHAFEEDEFDFPIASISTNKQIKWNPFYIR